MANTFVPFGFRDSNLNNAAAPSGAQSVYNILNTYTTPIYKGDPVVSATTGYIQQAAPGTTQIAGIFNGCSYTSISQSRRIWMPYWPGTSDAVAGSITAYVMDSPNQTFLVQTGNGGPFTIASIQSNANFAVGTGTAANGLSGAYLDFATIATTNTLPFRVISVAGQPGFPTIVGNGSDGTTAFNYAIVAFNNQNYNSLTGI